MKNSGELIFETARTSCYQDDASETFVIQLGQDEIRLRLCELVTLKRKVNRIDIVRMLQGESAEVELIWMPHCDRFFVFSIMEILELRDLFEGTFVMLELNSMVHRELVRKIG